MRWALLHPQVSFFKEGNGWYLCVMTPCSKLLPNNGCAVYENRPQICRDYEAGACEWPDGLDWDEHFETDADLQKYLDRRWNRSMNPGEPLPAYMRANVVVWPIELPTTKTDFDELRWAILHRNIAAYKENGQWFLLIGSTCSVHGPAACVNPSKRGWDEYIDTDDALRNYLERHPPHAPTEP